MSIRSHSNKQTLSQPSVNPVIQQGLNLKPVRLYLVNLTSSENFELVQGVDLGVKAGNPSPPFLTLSAT